MRGSQTPAEVEFLDAMAQGYISSRSERSVEEFLGLAFVGSSDRRVVDAYWVAGDGSTGFTLITLRGMPLWVMHYGGWYKPEAIPFLKSALRQAYEVEKKFYGGRGPVSWSEGGLTYTNNVLQPDFRNFSGFEFIVDSSGMKLGEHWYRGGYIDPNL